MVKKPTKGFKVLDVILSNLDSFYDEPLIVAPIIAGRADKGAPSDHKGVVATPHTNPNQPQQSSKTS